MVYNISRKLMQWHWLWRIHTHTGMHNKNNTFILQQKSSRCTLNAWLYFLHGLLQYLYSFHFDNDTFGTIITPFLLWSNHFSLHQLNWSDALEFCSSLLLLYAYNVFISFVFSTCFAGPMVRSLHYCQTQRQMAGQISRKSNTAS